MKLRHCLMRAIGAPLALIAFGACTNTKDSSDSQGMYVSMFAGEPTDLKICWKNGDRISAGARALLQAKLIEQFNGRTPIKFTFDEKPCSRVGGKSQTILAIDEGFDYNTIGLRGLPYSAGMNGKNCGSESIGGMTYRVYTNAGHVDVSRQAILCRAAYSIPADASDEKVAASLSFVLLHEVGHAVGLGHEHFRAPVTESPDACWRMFTSHVEQWNAVSKQNIVAEQLTAHGEYDSESVMDYCSTRRNETALDKIVLSAGDVATLNHLYAGSQRRSSTQPVARATPSTAVNPNAVARAGGGVQPTGDMDTPADAQPAAQPAAQHDAQPAAQPDAQPESLFVAASDTSVYCDMAKLRICVVDHGGGTGCLDPGRAQGECSRTPAAARKSVPFEATRVCMQSKSTAAEKMKCLD